MPERNTIRILAVVRLKMIMDAHRRELPIWERVIVLCHIAAWRKEMGLK